MKTNYFEKQNKNMSNNTLKSSHKNTLSESMVRKGFLFPHLYTNIVSPTEYQRLHTLLNDELITLIGQNDTSAAMYFVFYRHMDVIDSVASSFSRKWSCDLELFKAQMISELTLAFNRAGWGKIAEKDSPDGWVISIIKNTATNVLKQENNVKKVTNPEDGKKTYISLFTTESEVNWGKSDQDDASDNLFYHTSQSTFYADSFDTEQSLQACFSALTPIQRRIVELRQIDGFSSKETAQILSKELAKPIKAANIDNQLSRGLNKMRLFAQKDVA